MTRVDSNELEILKDIVSEKIDIVAGCSRMHKYCFKADGSLKAGYEAFLSVVDESLDIVPDNVDKSLFSEDALQRSMDTRQLIVKEHRNSVVSSAYALISGSK